MTPNKITESEIEQFAIELLKKQGYQYIYAPDIAPDSETPERSLCEDVLLVKRLRTAVGMINPGIPAEVREDAIEQIQRLNSPELIANNEAFHRMLTEGINVTYHKDGADRGDRVWLIDFNNPDQKAVNELFGKSLMDSTIRNFRTIRAEESRQAELQNTSMSKLINTDPMVKI